jgi:hypothetical protein
MFSTLSNRSQVETIFPEALYSDKKKKKFLTNEISVVGVSNYFCTTLQIDHYWTQPTGRGI